MGLLRLLLLSCAILSTVAFPQPAGPAVPQPARRHTRPGGKRFASDYPNPLVASRQVRADSLRGPQKAKRACPSFLPNGNCACPGTEVYCSASATCVNLQTNLNNCGACGTKCPQGTGCYEGSCSQCDPDSPSPDFCSGRCTNTQIDSRNCGTCGTICPTGTTCTGGGCVCETTHGYAVCNNVCVNTNSYLTDPNNCGACGFVCNTGTLECSGGDCVCDTANGYVSCNGNCVSSYFFTYSGANCGSCGHVCQSPTSGCLNSECICPQGLTYTPCGDDCFDLSSDPGHCGTCSTQCTSPTSGCSNGQCVCPQGPTYEVCDGNCVDLTSDMSHCGSCENACPSLSTCTDSACVCDEGYTLCNGVCYAASDFVTDNSNCGQCGNACSSGETCLNSACMPPYLVAFAYASTPTVPFCYLQYLGAPDGYYCGDIANALAVQATIGGPQNMPVLTVYTGYLALELPVLGDKTMTPSTKNFAQSFIASSSSYPGSGPGPVEGGYWYESGIWTTTGSPGGILSLTASWYDSTIESYELSFWIEPNEAGHYVRATANPSWIMSEYASEDIQQVVGLLLPEF